MSGSLDSHVGPTLSVVIPTRNRAPILERTLATVLAQRAVDLEVVVVDEASSDGTPSLLRDHPDGRVRTIRHEAPQGVSRARNHGVEAARGEWIAFTDDDDLWSPDKLSRQLDALAGLPGSEWCCVGAVVVDDRLRPIAEQRPPRSGDAAPGLLARNEIPGGASSVVARRSLVLGSGGFDPALSNLADHDLWVRLALRSPIATVDEPLVAYVVHGGAMSRDVDAARRELATVVEKYAEARAARRVEVDRAFYGEYFAEMHQRSGRRVPAALEHLVLAREHGRPRSWLWSALSVWPGAIQARDRLHRRRMTPAWRAAAEAWLGDVPPVRDGVSSPFAGVGPT